MTVAKLWKGPGHGKRYEVPDGQTTILFKKSTGLTNMSWTFTNGAIANTFSLDTVTYYKSSHTQPDGAVFFIYEGA